MNTEAPAFLKNKMMLSLCWTTFTFFAAPFPPLRHNCYRSRLLTNMYIFVIVLKNFSFRHELEQAWL